MLMVAFALLVVNSVYLLCVSTAGVVTGADHQTVFSIWMFLVHVVVGLAMSVPFLWFGVAHFRRARPRTNRAAKRLGLISFWAGILTILTGLLLMRIELGSLSLSVRSIASRDTLWWLHIVAPCLLVWAFILHRLAGPTIRWRMGGALAVFAVAGGALGFVLHTSMTGTKVEVDPKAGDKYFEPSLARTASGGFLPASSLMQNDECLACHQDLVDQWSHSVHAASSFNNPLYAFSVRETRSRAFEREGSVQDARFCAGCHDPAPFFSGAFEDPKWDDPHYDAARDPMGSAGITCTACHSITALNSPRGNADYVISQPIEYPLGGSTNPFLRWINHQLIRSRPGLHKRTFLKPEVHRTSEFCGTCHKVFLPEDLNDYRWLRGQNHYDSFRLSGVSGAGAQSWYYPAEAKANCAACHMQPLESNDPAAKPRGGPGDGGAALSVLDHGFNAANTATGLVSGQPDALGTIARCEKFTKGVMNVDIFGIRQGGEIDGVLHAPLRPQVPTLVRGQRYLIETVVRNLLVGHEFTQGTADSNEVWLDIDVRSGGKSIGRSGGFDASRGVDPWSKFLNAYVIDRDGNRIERRNPQDIFVTLYNHQIPPGAADLTHFAFTLPKDAGDSVSIKVALRYRKFDLTYWRAVMGAQAVNDLPILTLATDEIELPVADLEQETQQTLPSKTELLLPWMRWYDYGISLFRQGERTSAKGDLRQAMRAFDEVGKLGRAEGALGRARCALKEGRIDDAAEALRQSATMTPAGYPWSIRWFSALANRQNGSLEDARADLESLIASNFPQAVERGFDFSRDDRVLVEYGNVLMELARRNGGKQGAATECEQLCMQALDAARQALAMDPESVSAWYLMAQAQTELGNAAAAEEARAQHAKYKPDENARDRAVNMARLRDAAANHASEAIVIYDLQRSDRFEGEVTNPPIPWAPRTYP